MRPQKKGTYLDSPWMLVIRSPKICGIFAAVFAGVFLALIDTFGYHLPRFMHPLVTKVYNGGFLAVMLQLILGPTIISAGIALVIGVLEWTYRHVRGMKFNQHIKAIAFSVFNVLLMCLSAKYAGYALVKAIFERIHFTVIPQHYCVYSALIVSIILFFVDYRVSANHKFWCMLLLSHALYGILASFALYAVAILILIAVIAPLFKLLLRFGEICTIFYEAHVEIGFSHEDAMIATNAIMHSSIGWLAMLFYRSDDD